MGQAAVNGSGDGWVHIPGHVQSSSAGREAAVNIYTDITGSGKCSLDSLMEGGHAGVGQLEEGMEAGARPGSIAACRVKEHLHGPPFPWDARVTANQITQEFQIIGSFLSKEGRAVYTSQGKGRLQLKVRHARVTAAHETHDDTIDTSEGRERDTITVQEIETSRLHQGLSKQHMVEDRRADG